MDLAGARVVLEQARGELAGAQARLARLLGRPTSADLQVAELESAWATYEAAVRALDAVTRSLRLQRLENAARVADAAVRDYRAARAAWVRRSAILPP
ncbi:MAG: hypothetical protein HYU37_09300 [Acidobacteria bacterium]|nr:hypothetical protein [Acidobacteriota bacterium]